MPSKRGRGGHNLPRPSLILLGLKKCCTRSECEGRWRSSGRSIRHCAILQQSGEVG